MTITRRSLLQGAAAATALSTLAVVGCSSDRDPAEDQTSAASGSLRLDPGSWSYDADHDVYHQVAVTYVASPQSQEYETLAICVPGAYFTGTDNGDGTFTTAVNDSGAVGDYTAATAPYAMPVNTPGYSAQKPLESYSYDSVSSFMEAGIVYVHAGLRGRDSNGDGWTGNAPWGVTDLKAAVRFVRYNADGLPGDPDAVYVFGHSGGGAQSAIAGASGDSDLYTTYLTTLGAAMTDSSGGEISDAVAGVMAWCPITSLDLANAAYEWNMGQFSTADTRADGTWTAQYSRELAIAFAQQIETLGLTDASGTALTLAQSGDGVYLAGSYYDHVVSVAEESLNNFLADTTFPYTPSSQTMAGMGTAPEGGSPEAGGEPPSGEMPSGGAPGGEAPGGGAPGGEMPGSTGESTTYESVDDYIAALNESTTWVDYDASTNTARISGLGGFVQSQKNPSKSVGAFDAVDRTQTENVVFGLGEEGRHFDQVSADVIAAHESDFSSLTGWDDAYSAEHYTTDLAEKDSLGVTTIQRAKAYNPMYFLSPSYEGYQSSTVAPNWRIRTGIMQGDTASTTEINLALALGSYGIANVDFATVWGQGHTMAERSGDATENFIAWISERTHA